MKISQRLFSGFIGIVMMIGIMGYISLSQLHKIAKPLHNEIPESIKMLANTSLLDSLAQFIRYYDEVLTQSARNYAFTQDKRWKERYKETEPKLDRLIKEAIEIGDTKDKIFFHSVDKANFDLVEMEYASIKLVDNKQKEQAISILEGKKYWNIKAIYEKGLRDYVARRGVEYDEALGGFTEVINLATKEVRNSIKIGTRVISTLTVVIFIVSLWLGIIISRTIGIPIARLRDATAEIGKGNMDEKIETKSKDEIGNLAESFNKMVINLKKSQEELIASKLYTDSIIVNMTEALIVFDSQGLVKIANKAALKILGYKEEELMDKSIEEIFLSSGYSLKDKIFGELIKKGSLYGQELIIKTKLDEQISTMLSACLIKGTIKADSNEKNKENYSFVCLIQDMEQMNELVTNLIDAKKKLELFSADLEDKVSRRTKDLARAQSASLNMLEDLANSKTYVENIIANLADILIVINFDGNICKVNQAAYVMLEYQEKELISKHISEVIAENQNFLNKFFRNEKVKNIEGNLRKKNGEIISTVFSSSFMKDKQDQSSGIVVIAKDISELKKREKELRNAYQKQSALMGNLEETNKIMVGRELKMITLKKELNQLSSNMGKDKPYDLSFLDENI